MSSVTNLPTAKRANLLQTFGERYNVDPAKVLDVLTRTCFRTEKAATNEQMMSLLVVANQYQLNPFTKEIYAFEDKNRGIVPVVSVDGWTRIINEHPQLAAVEFEYADDGSWIDCIIERRDRTRPTRIREYLSECKRSTGPWQSHPQRMLRHKALIQCARVAFGFAGIYEQDEAERIVEGQATVVSTGKPHTTAPRAIAQAPAEAEFATTITEPAEAVAVEPSLASADLEPPANV